MKNKLTISLVVVAIITGFLATGNASAKSSMAYQSGFNHGVSES